MGRVYVTHGARAAEALLLERLELLLAESARDTFLLARPIRVVVPSGSLRDHLLARLVARRSAAGASGGIGAIGAIGAAGAGLGNRAVVGLTVQTLFGLAGEIVERAGETLPVGERLFEVVARREARREPALREALDGLVEGFASVLGSVRDLLDAGLEPIHAEACEEALRSDGPALAGRAAVERAVALVRTAARCDERMAELGRGGRGHLLRRANELLREAAGRGESIVSGVVSGISARAVFIHGFADATGVASDLLETLLRHFDAQALLDHPPKVFDERNESAFAGRLGARFLHAAPWEERVPEAPPATLTLRALEAAGTDAEVRAVAQRLRDLLSTGARPETIGLVARDLTPYRFALARHLTRLGIPFSAPGTSGALDRSDQRCAALLELLEKGEATATDRWLDAQAPDQDSPALARQVDLRLALHSLGAARLRAVADVPLDRVLRGSTVPLPIRQGLGGAVQGNPEEDDPEIPASDPGLTGDPAVRSTRRSVPSRAVRELVRSAARTRRHLEGWPERAPLAVHARYLRSLLAEGLGWRAEGDLTARIEEALRGAAAEIPSGYALVRDELGGLLERLLLDGIRTPLGGKGGGIQLLSVTEARGRTFDHLFVLGLQRNSFPRVVRQDPLFPDDLRLVLQRVLPDIPIKLAGYDEERYLFAQLLSASPSVTLSWQGADDDGKPLPSSPLVDRLRGRIEIERAPSLWSSLAARELLTASERLTYFGLGSEGAGRAAGEGGRESFARFLPWALSEARREPVESEPIDREPSAPLRALARGRVAVLAELDPDLRTEEGRAVRAKLGPYFGFIGGSGGRGGSGALDPRGRPLYVTQLENLAACPWQLFLERLLGIEPAPDPTGLLPGIDASLLGRTIHAVLEGIGRAVLPQGQPGAPLAVPVPAPWPETAALERLALETADRLLAEDGVHLSGLAGALARQTLPFLEVARRVDWAAGPLPLLGVEVEGEIKVSTHDGRSLPLRFRADRLDIGPAGEEARGESGRRWTDYKTGRPLSSAKKVATRAAHLLARVRAGTHLQAVAYLRAARGDGTELDAIGRYLYLHPAVENDEMRELAVRAGDAPFLAAFERATSALLASWESGSFFPRLVDTKGREEPARCKRCQVAEACLRGDSGARRRLFEWTIGQEAARAEAEGGPEKALLATWLLAASAGDETREGATANEPERGGASDASDSPGSPGRSEV